MRCINIPFIIAAFVVAEMVDYGFADEGFLDLSAGPSHFSFPPNCSKTAKPKDKPFCATGEVDLGLKWLVNIDIYLFDAFDPSKTVLFGFNATINEGIPEALEVRTGGCAAPVVDDLIPKFLPHFYGMVVTVCTSGGGPGKYDPKTQSFSAPFNISGDSALYINGMRSRFVFPFNGDGDSWVKPHFDVGLTAPITFSAGGPKVLEISLSYINTIATVNGSVLTWHLFNGMSFDIHSDITGHHYHNRTFANETIQLQPPQ
ncbi:hypothetical protein FOZ61_000787 [Perkinsus olseni]|uniref:Protein arginine methyltransferase 10 n=1 Tax=Perkinsus olseni TaxID=32597 RepID=A0A7J6LZU0_PEROL|nr:hypothetical protein FOZ61_000787 [Perkinsus olseni]